MPLYEAQRGGPDVDEMDAHIRAVMQAALDRLACERRLAVLG